jgi:hypothetical protein
MPRHGDLANPADDPVRAPAATAATSTIACSPRPRDRMGPDRRARLAPPGALFTCWPRNKREGRRPSGAAFGLQPNTQDYAHSTASCVIAITAIAD